jgi:hypothetical protein
MVRAKGSKKPTLLGCDRRLDLETSKANPHSRKSRASPSNDVLTVSGLKSHPSRVGSKDAFDLEDY